MKLRLGNWIGLAAIVVLVDQWTKHLVRGALRNGEVIRVTDWFDLVLARVPQRLPESGLPGQSKIREAMALLAELTHADELADFLTLPAYERI